MFACPDRNSVSRNIQKAGTVFWIRWLRWQGTLGDAQLIVCTISRVQYCSIIPLVLGA